MNTSDARWVEEAIRLHRRYEREVVEEWGLCPWAARARREGRVREHVLLQSGATSFEPSLAVIRAFEDESDLALLIYPRIGLGRRDFLEFAARVRDADLARRGMRNGPFLFAVFHPEAAADATEPERLVPFLRRTPDPTIQVLRATVLERIGGPASDGTRCVDPSIGAAMEPPQPAVRERIAHANWETALRRGVATLTVRLDDIACDRERTYRALRATPRVCE